MIWCCCQIWAHLITSTCARHSSAATAVTGFHSHITYSHMNCKVQWFKSGIDRMMLLRRLTLSNRVPWQNWMAAYLGYTLRMKTLFRGWPVMAHETHTRRRRLPPQSDHNTLKYHTQALCGCVPGAVELALSVSWVDGVKGDLNQTLASLDLVLCTLVSSLVAWLYVLSLRGVGMALGGSHCVGPADRPYRYNQSNYVTYFLADTRYTFTIKPILFTCPLFHDLGVRRHENNRPRRISEITPFTSTYPIEPDKNAKIKGAEII